MFFSKSVEARHKTFGPKELASLLTILSEVRLVHVDLFTSAAQAIAPRVRELRPAELMRCTRALSRCGVKNEAFCQAVGDDICGRWSKQAGLRCEDLVELCWCFAVLEAYHHDLLQLMFQVLRETQKVSADALCQLYELHLSLESIPQEHRMIAHATKNCKRYVRNYIYNSFVLQMLPMQTLREFNSSKGRAQSPICRSSNRRQGCQFTS